jgi:hypothetical protein
VIRRAILGAVMLSVTGLVVCAVPLISFPMIGPISILDLAGGAFAQGSWSIYRIMTVLSYIALAAGAVLGTTVIVRRIESRSVLIGTVALTVFGTAWVLVVLIVLA